MKTRKVLIVDDDTFSRGVMEKLLQSYTDETFSCALAEEAIARLKQEPFNILITDLHMPGMDGLELIRHAKAIYPELLTILVSGFPGEGIRSRAEEEGVDGFFSKPIDWDELYELLGTLSIPEKFQNMPENTRKGPSISRRIFFSFSLFLFVSLNVQPLVAQQLFFRQKPAPRMGSQEACWQSTDLVLTEGQTKALESLQHAYMAEAMPLRKELIPLRFELRHLIRYPDGQSKILLDRQKRISELQGKLESLSLSYQIKARSILTKEQLERLPTDCSLGMDTGFEIMIGIGGGPRRGYR